MKFLFVLLLFICYALQSFSQDTKSVIINDTTELQEYSNGESLKVNFRLNDRILTISQKERLLKEYPGIRQEFNIKKTDSSIVGEIHFFTETLDVETQLPKPSSLEISKNPIGKPLPDFTWTDINGNVISQDYAHGKIIVLNFWHTSCVPCIAEMPLLNKIAEKYANAEIVFIAVSPNSRTELIGFLEKRQFKYQQIPAVDTKTIISPFPGWPIHVIINSKGLIEFFALGKQENIEKKLEDIIDKLLTKKP